MITPIERSLEFPNKFRDKIIDKNQLTRFLGSLNYFLDFCPNINRITKFLYNRKNRRFRGKVILKQKNLDSLESIVRFTSSHWNDAQKKNNSTIKKEILSIVFFLFSIISKISSNKKISFKN